MKLQHSGLNVFKAWGRLEREEGKGLELGRASALGEAEAVV